MLYKRLQIIAAKLLVMGMLISQTAPSFAQTAVEKDDQPKAPITSIVTETVSIWTTPVEIEATATPIKSVANEPTGVDETASNLETMNQRIFLPLVSSEENAAENVEAAATTASWRRLLTEGFEGEWPVPPIGVIPGWRTFDCNGNTAGELYWDDVSYMKASGSWSARPISGGRNFAPTFDFYYPDYTCARMIYGPFNLVDSAQARFFFKYWIRSESGYDFLRFGYSCDGNVFSNLSVTADSNGWQNSPIRTFRCPGDPTVWIGFEFTSDGSITGKGAFVDDIVLEVYR